jgi:acyl-coenzyme A synthetase/AMP-(fatty) acid ligase
VAPGLTASAILAELRKRVDPFFLPRPLCLVDALPRSANGKLPRESLRALSASPLLKTPNRASTYRASGAPRPHQP